MKVKPISTECVTSVSDSLKRAVSELSPQALCELRNQLVPTELAILNAEQECKIYALADIEAWGESVGITYTSSDHLPGYPINYWIDNEPSDMSFCSESDALKHAFEHSF
jgi:hypothetical protein